MHVVADILRVAAIIAHVAADKAVEEAKVFSGFSMVKVHFFQKVVQTQNAKVEISTFGSGPPL